MTSTIDNDCALKRKYFEELGGEDIPQCFPKQLTTKDNLKLRWIERITSSYIPSANFIFEVSFPDVDSMRFEAISKCLYYSEDSDDFMECCAVNEVMPFFANVIYPGDILLRVNGQSLLRKSVSGEFIDPQKSSSCLENIAAAASAAITASSAPSPVTIRFMRTGSTSINFTPSPAELNLFQVDKHIAAKFVVVKVPGSLQKEASATNPNPIPVGPQWSIQLSYLDQQLPSGISQMMLGGSVTWSHALHLSNSGPAALAQCTQGGVLPTSSGVPALIHGPGAFIGSNGAPTNLSDCWVTPYSSNYTALPAQMKLTMDSSLPSKIKKISTKEDISSNCSTVAAYVNAILKKNKQVVESGKELDDEKIKVKDIGYISELHGDDEGDQKAATVISAGCTVHLLDASTFTGTSGGITLGAAGGLTAGPGLVGATGIFGSIMGAHGSGTSVTSNINSAAASNSLKHFPRWAVALKVLIQTNHSSSENENILLHLGIGRFENQSDAQFAGQKAVELVNATKQFRPKHFAAKFATAFPAYMRSQQEQQQQQTLARAPASHHSVSSSSSHYSSNAPASAAGINRPASHGFSTGPTPSGLGTGAGAGASKYSYGAGGQQFRPGAPAATNHALNTALSNKYSSTGQTSCNGFASVAKVVVNLAPQSGLHNSGSSSNVNGMNSHVHHRK